MARTCQVGSSWVPIFIYLFLFFAKFGHVPPSNWVWISCWTYPEVIFLAAKLRFDKSCFSKMRVIGQLGSHRRSCWLHRDDELSCGFFLLELLRFNLGFIIGALPVQNWTIFRLKITFLRIFISMTAAIEISVSFGSANSGQNPTRFYGDFGGSQLFLGEQNL